MGETERSSGANHILRRSLGLRDLVLTQILCVVGSSWVGVAGGLGRAQTLTWIAAMLLFYVPMAASVIGLNRKMPLEGGLYVWAHQSFGDLGGFLTAWNIWVYGIAVTATILYAIPTELAYFIGPRASWLPENHLASLAIVTAMIAGVTAAALRGLELGKWIHNTGGAAMLIVFAALILLPLWALARHVPIYWTPFAVQIPPANLRTMALFGQMMFGALCGLEYIAILAGESRQPAQSIGRSVWISSPIICAMFILGTGSVVALVPRGQIDFIAPIPQTLRMALGNTGWGNLLAMTAIFLVELRLLGAAELYLYRRDAAAHGCRLGSPGARVVYPAAQGLANAGKLDSLRSRPGLSARGSGKYRSSCTGGVPTAVERQPDALRDCVPGHVCHTAGRTGGATPVFAMVAQMDLSGGFLRNGVQPAHLFLSVCGRSECARLHGEDRGHDRCQQSHCGGILPAAQQVSNRSNCGVDGGGQRLTVEEPVTRY